MTLTQVPEETFSYEELQGYLFGIAMTPDIILPSEWVPVIFGGTMPQYRDTRQAEKMYGHLMKIYNTLVSRHNSGKLVFSFDLENLDETDLENLYQWISGFEEALALREELWDPEEFKWLSETNKQDIYHSLMTVQGLVDPAEVADFTDTIPEELFREIFPEQTDEPYERELQIQFFFIASLPLAIKTLQDHSQNLADKKRQLKTKTAPLGKKRKKDNIIEVDFTRGKK